MNATLQPVSTYQQFTRNVQTGSKAARRAFMHLARYLDGRTALAISCAVRGESPEAAAEHCECEIRDLDMAISAFAVSMATAGSEAVA